MENYLQRVHRDKEGSTPLDDTYTYTPVAPDTEFYRSDITKKGVQQVVQKARAMSTAESSGVPYLFYNKSAKRSENY